MIGRFCDKCGRSLSDDTTPMTITRGRHDRFDLCTDCSAGVVAMLEDMRLFKEPIIR